MKYLLDNDYVYRIVDELDHDCVFVNKYKVTKRGVLSFQYQCVVPLSYGDIISESLEEAINATKDE